MPMTMTIEEIMQMEKQEQEKARANFPKHLDEFVQAWINLSTDWENLSDDDLEKTWVDGYPFELSFDDMIFEVMEWRDNLRESFNN